MKLKKRKTILKGAALSLTGIGAVAGSAVAVVACASTSVKNYALLPTYTGQADILLSLGVAPDYYPVQLNQSTFYDYLTDPASHMALQQALNPDFVTKFSAKLRGLVGTIGETGRSWWNQTAEARDQTNPDPEYWTHKDGELLLYERYLLDDDKKVIDSTQAPAHDTAVLTNFRASRDPFTRLSRELIMNHDSPTSPFQNPNNAKALANDLNFAEWVGHRIEGDPYFDSLLYTSTDYIFDSDTNKDKWIAKMYDLATLTSDEKAALNVQQIDYLTRIGSVSYPTATSRSVSYSVGSLSPNPDYSYLPLRHHPIYDSATEIGEAPAFEGASRDNLLYLYTMATDITKALNDKADLLKSDSRRAALVQGQANAKKIIANFKAREANIKTLFDELGITGKTFALVTVNPGGGADTIQTNGKYAFIYKDLGLKQVWPSSWNAAQKAASTPVEGDVINGSLYNMDDNGWFWDITLSNGTGNATQFANQADFGLITARPANWTALGTANQAAVKNIFKSNGVYQYQNSDISDYDLWNEGLKTPLVLNMLLDQILEQAVAYYKKSAALGSTYDEKTDPKFTAAAQWGDYWTTDYVK